MRSTTKFANANISWPISHVLAYVVVTVVVHMSIIVGGMVLIPGFVLYPVKPIVAFRLLDALMVFITGLVIASFSASSTSSAVPLVGTSIIIVCLTAQVYKCYVLARFGSNRKNHMLVSGA